MVSLAFVLVDANSFTEYWQRKNAAARFHWNMTDFEKVETDLEAYIERNGNDKAGLKYGFFEENGGWVDLEEVAKEYGILLFSMYLRPWPIVN